MSKRVSATILNELSKRIKKAREESNLSQKELGQSLGLSDKTISSYEKGRSLPSLNQLKKIAQKTDYPLSFFTEEKKSTNDVLEKKIKTIEKELTEIKRLLKYKGK